MQATKDKSVCYPHKCKHYQTSVRTNIINNLSARVCEHGILSSLACWLISCCKELLERHAMDLSQRVIADCLRRNKKLLKYLWGWSLTVLALPRKCGLNSTVNFCVCKLKIGSSVRPGSSIRFCKQLSPESLEILCTRRLKNPKWIKSVGYSKKLFGRKAIGSCRTKTIAKKHTFRWKIMQFNSAC
jgi:hypothetical protein